MTVIIDYAPTSASLPLLLTFPPSCLSPSPSCLSSANPSCSSSKRGHLLGSLRFVSFCVYASWSTRWFRNNDILLSRDEFDRLWTVAISCLDGLLLVDDWEFWKISIKEGEDRNNLENWYECFWIILYSWAHALSRARGYIRPDYAEGGPINVRRRPLFVRTRSLRSVANFSRGASPLLRDSSICPIFRWLGRRGPIQCRCER